MSESPGPEPETGDDEESMTSDVGAMDGTAAAGSAGAVSEVEDNDGAIPTSAPDPFVSPD